MKATLTAAQRADRTMNSLLQGEIQWAIAEYPYADRAFLVEVLKCFRCGNAESKQTPDGLRMAAAFEAVVRDANVEVIPFERDMVVVPREEYECLLSLRRKVAVFPSGTAGAA